MMTTCRMKPRLPVIRFALINISRILSSQFFQNFRSRTKEEENDEETTTTTEKMLSKHTRQSIKCMSMHAQRRVEIQGLTVPHASPENIHARPDKL